MGGTHPMFASHRSHLPLPRASSGLGGPPWQRRCPAPPPPPPPPHTPTHPPTHHTHTHTRTHTHTHTHTHTRPPARPPARPHPTPPHPTHTRNCTAPPACPCRVQAPPGGPLPRGAAARHPPTRAAPPRKAGAGVLRAALHAASGLGRRCACAAGGAVRCAALGGAALPGGATLLLCWCLSTPEQRSAAGRGRPARMPGSAGQLSAAAATAAEPPLALPALRRSRCRRGADPAVLPVLRDLRVKMDVVGWLPAEWSRGFRKLTHLVIMGAPVAAEGGQASHPALPSSPTPDRGVCWRAVTCVGRGGGGGGLERGRHWLVVPSPRETEPPPTLR